MMFFLHLRVLLRGEMFLFQVAFSSAQFPPFPDTTQLAFCSESIPDRSNFCKVKSLRIIIYFTWRVRQTQFPQFIIVIHSPNTTFGADSSAAHSLTPLSLLLISLFQPPASHGVFASLVSMVVVKTWHEAAG